jgi:hypothetical protein
MRHILAIDEGTTGVTCLMVAAGAAVAWARDDGQAE